MFEKHFGHVSLMTFQDEKNYGTIFFCMKRGCQKLVNKKNTLTKLEHSNFGGYHCFYPESSHDLGVIFCLFIYYLFNFNFCWKSIYFYMFFFVSTKILKICHCQIRDFCLFALYKN